MEPDTTSIAGYAIYRESPSTCCSTSGSKSLRIPNHPLDQLTIYEIPQVTRLIREDAAPKLLKFNSITLREPLKKEYAAFRDGLGPRPARKAFAIVIEAGTCNVSEVLVNLTSNKVETWKHLKDVMPTLTLEDLDITERIARTDPGVIEACKELGINDMTKVYIDAWAIGYDDRWGFETRLQQGLAYYRKSEFDNQYAHPLDFSVTVDTEKEEVLSVDIRRVNRERTAIPINK